jgi:hypothetical protein
MEARPKETAGFGARSQDLSSISDCASARLRYSSPFVALTGVTDPHGDFPVAADAPLSSPGAPTNLLPPARLCRVKRLGFQI